MRLKLLFAVAAVLVGTSSAFLEIETASLVPLLTQIPFVEELLELIELLGLPSPLGLLPETLFTKEQFWAKIGYGLAGTGVGIIEIASFIGYIFNYLDKIEAVNLEQREAAEAMMEAMEAEEAAAAAAEGEGEGGAEVEAAERFHSIMPYNGPTLPDYMKARLANRRVANQRSPRPAPRRPARRPAKPVARTPRPYPSRIYRRRLLLKRSAEAPTLDDGGEGVMGRSAAVAPPKERGEGVMGLLTRKGKQILELLKKLFLKEAQTGAVGREMKNLLEEAADSLAEELMQQLDPDGCLKKLLCHLQERPSDSLTPEEDALATVFLVRRPHAQCAADHFPRCVLSVEQLEALLPPVPPRNTNAIP